MDFLRKSSGWMGIGILLGSGFFYSWLWWVSLIGVGCHLQALQSDRSLREKFWGSFMAWTVKFFFVLFFYFDMYPISWLPVEFGSGELLLIGLYWSTVSMFLGTGGLVLVALYHLIKRLHTPLWLQLYVLVPVVWVAAEVAGSFLLSIFTHGPGSQFNAYFSLGYVGHLLGHHQLLALLGFFAGAYGLSFLVVMATQLLLRHYSPLRVIVILIVLCATALLGLLEPDAEATHTVALIETSYPAQELFVRGGDALKHAQTEALEAAHAAGADYIVFPEDSRFFDQAQLNAETAFYNFRYPESKAIIIDGGRLVQNDSMILQSVVFDSDSGAQEITHKKYLVPQGEFMPILYEQFFRLLGFNTLMDDMKNLVSYQIGPETSQAHFAPNMPSVLFCFEATSATGVRAAVADRDTVPFVAHQAAYSWFPYPRVLMEQLHASLRIQAIWNQVYLASTASFGESLLYTPRGNIITPNIVAEGQHWQVSLVTIPVQ